MPHERRILLPSIATHPVGTELPLSSEQRHYLLDVLRLSASDYLTASDPVSGREVLVELIPGARGEEARVRIVKEIDARQPPSRVRSLVFALCKGDHNDLVCQKATEFGVQNVLFWQAARSVVRLTPKDAPAKLARWEKIAAAACAQAGQPRAPGIKLCLSLNELLTALAPLRSAGDRLLCCSLSPQAVEFRKLPPAQAGVHLLVGPEGDLAPDEEAELVRAGFELASLGPCRLRAETAAIAAVAAAQTLWGHHESAQ